MAPSHQDDLREKKEKLDTKRQAFISHFSAKSSFEKVNICNACIAYCILHLYIYYTFLK